VSPKEFKDAQERIGWSNRRMAAALGVTEDTVCIWRNGRREVPGPVSVAVKALADGWRPE
jgi:DNA-binding transcriptional regulator YiaG